MMLVIDLWGVILFHRWLAVHRGSEYPSLGSGRSEQKGAEGQHRPRFLFPDKNSVRFPRL